VLAQAIVTEGIKNLAAGSNPMLLQRGIQKATVQAVQAIKALAIPIKGKEELAEIASISAADPEIGQMLSEVMDKVGKDGVITVEESKGIKYEVEYVEGMQL